MGKTKNFIAITKIKDRKSITKVEWGKIYQEEYDYIVKYCKVKGKNIEDINAKTVSYVAGSKIPYKCGGSAPMFKGSNDMNGYILFFHFHGEPTITKEPKPNQKWGVRK